jgi:hypothetical protein
VNIDRVRSVESGNNKVTVNFEGEDGWYNTLTLEPYRILTLQNGDLMRRVYRSASGDAIHLRLTSRAWVRLGRSVDSAGTHDTDNR